MNDFYLKCLGEQVTLPEREFIKATAEAMGDHFRDPLFVNIGVSWGATIHCLRAGAPHARLIGVDLDYDKRKIWRPDLLDAKLLAGDSGIIHRRFERDIHLLLVDGCHRYDAVKADIAGWTPKVVPGGVVIFHDYAPIPKDMARFPELSGVKEAVDEWAGGNEDWERLDALDSLACFVRVT